MPYYYVKAIKGKERERGGRGKKTYIEANNLLPYLGLFQRIFM